MSITPPEPRDQQDHLVQQALQELQELLGLAEHLALQARRVYLDLLEPQAYRESKASPVFSDLASLATPDQLDRLVLQARQAHKAARESLGLPALPELLAPLDPQELPGPQVRWVPQAPPPTPSSD